MYQYKKRQRGISILEMLLAAAIAASLILLSVRMYRMFKQDSDIQKVQAQVDTLFQALGMYYKKNCYGTADPNATNAGQILPGTLNPLSNPSSPFPIDINLNLIKAGYFQSMTTAILPPTPFVDTSPPGVNGFVAQFNQAPSEQRMVCVETIPGVSATGPTNAQNCVTAKAIGTIIIWKAQVAMRLKDTANAQLYLKLLKGDCLSKLAGTVVTPCVPGSSTSTGNYVVWERLPSHATSQMPYDSLVGNKTEQQFNQMYTTYPMIQLLNSTPSGTTTSAVNQQYFLCGG